MSAKRRRTAGQKSGASRPRTTRSAASASFKPTPPTTGRRQGNGRVPIELTIEREAEAWELHKQGYSQADIAVMLTGKDPKHPIGQQAISKAIRRVEETLSAELLEKVERYKVSQVGRLEGIYLLAMQSYRHSKGIQKTTRRKAGRGRLEIIQEGKTNEPGDPRWLEKAMEALRDQRKILGIDAPLKFDGSIKSDRPLEDLTDDELLREHAAIQARITKQIATQKRKGS